MMPARGGRSAKGSAYCSRSDFLERERDINRNYYRVAQVRGLGFAPTNLLVQVPDKRFGCQHTEANEKQAAGNVWAAT